MPEPQVLAALARVVALPSRGFETRPHRRVSWRCGRQARFLAGRVHPWPARDVGSVGSPVRGAGWDLESVSVADRAWVADAFGAGVAIDRGCVAGVGGHALRSGGRAARERRTVEGGNGYPGGREADRTPASSLD